MLAEAHAQQLLTALSHGRPLGPVPETVDRDQLYASVLSPRTHDMHFGYAKNVHGTPAWGPWRGLRAAPRG